MFDLPEGASTIAGQVDSVYLLILAVSGLALLASFGAIAVGLIRSRRLKEAYESDRREGNVGMIVTVVLSILLFGGIGVASEVVWDDINEQTGLAADTILLAPRQFQWDVYYRGEDGQFRTEDDPRTINRIVIPLRRPVRIEMKASDVIHSFFVPAFRIKRDAIPGSTSVINLEATRSGVYELACTEYCGLGHYRMRALIEVVPAEEYRRWIDSVNQAFSSADDSTRSE